MHETDPCKRCGGTGREPDPVTQAHDALVMLIAELSGMVTPEKRDELQNAAFGYHQASLRRMGDHQARVTFLEAGLRDFLSYARENGPGTATMFMVDHEKVRDWKAILDGEQTQPPTINQQRAAHGLQPWPGTIGETPVPGLGGAYQRVHIDECSYGGRDHSGTCFGEG